MLTMLEVVPQKSSLAQSLSERIKNDGPLTFRDWMQVALYDPVEGYYRKHNRKIWGREGDYRTSPERSELFAATFARYFAELYGRLGNPESFSIVEAGGGEGQFAAGVLQTLRNYFPNVFAATHYVFDEIGEPARMVARDRLTTFDGQVEFASLDHLRIDCGVVFTNELIDAFPVHRVVVVDGELCEYYVNVADQGKFAWTIGPPSTPRLAAYVKQHDIHLSDGQSAEINLEVEPWLKLVAESLKRGYVVTVDYGAETPELYSRSERFDGTLRGFHKHGLVDSVLEARGDHDLTSTVNWTVFKAMGETAGLKTLAFARQDKFLLEQGLLEQLQLQSEGISEAEKIRLSTAARDMILPNSMAASFQVLVQEKPANF
jgi:SAM-dependent MidA family methyltransferase